MTIAKISSPDPKYIAATDLLIGDMSDINYEYLVLNRPIILLANVWLEDNFPDIGLKLKCHDLGKGIERCLNNPDEYQMQRELWLKKTIYKPGESAADRVLNTAIDTSGFIDPEIIIIHGDSDVRKSNLLPIYQKAIELGIKAKYINKIDVKESNPDSIYIAAHFKDLDFEHGYKVHLDHGLKGQGTANIEMAIKEYKDNLHFPLINLHITAGKAGDIRTKMLLGPNSGLTRIAGYPKIDHIIKLNNQENRRSVCKELGLDVHIPIVTYAPAGRKSISKPGGSLSPKVLRSLYKLSKLSKYNILIKLKEPKPPLMTRILYKVRYIMRKIY